MGGGRGFLLAPIAAAYIVTLGATVQIGMGLGLSELSTADGSIRPSVSYRADLPAVAPVETVAVPAAILNTVEAAAWRPTRVVASADAMATVLATVVPDPAPSSIGADGGKRTKGARDRVARQYAPLGARPAHHRR
jgi:hypothetical protein